VLGASVFMARADLTMGLCRNGMAGYLAEAPKADKAAVVLSDCTVAHSAYLVLRRSRIESESHSSIFYIATCDILQPFLSTKLAQAAALLTRVREGSGSNLGRDTDYTDRFVAFLSVPREVPG
jgi:hypothetical protein